MWAATVHFIAVEIIDHRYTACRLWQKDPKCKDVNKDESQCSKGWADGVTVNITTFDLVLAVEMKVRILLCAILCYVKERYFLAHLLRFACSFTGRPGPEQTIQRTNLSENWVDDTVTTSLFNITTVYTSRATFLSFPVRHQNGNASPNWCTHYTP